MIRKALVAGVAAAALSTPVLAEEVTVSGNVAVSTEYVWRGVTQSNGDISISGGFDLEAGGFYAGTWLANVDFEDASDTNIEWDIYAGYGGEFAGGVGYDVGMIYYMYPDSDDSDLDFLEIYGGLSYEFEGGPAVGGTLYWDPDNETMYLDTSVDFAITETVSVGAVLGAYLDGFDEYTNWGLGATWASPVGLDLSLFYYDNDLDGGDDAIVFSVAKSL